MRRRRNLPPACSRRRTPQLTPCTCWPMYLTFWTPLLLFVTSTCPTISTATPSMWCASSLGIHNTRPPYPWYMHADITWQEHTNLCDGSLLSQLFCRIFFFHVHAHLTKQNRGAHAMGSLCRNCFAMCVLLSACRLPDAGQKWGCRRGMTRCTAVRGWMTWHQTRCWPASSLCVRQPPRWVCATHPCLRIMRARAWRLHRPPSPARHRARARHQRCPSRPRARAAWGSASAPASARSSTLTLSHP